jgi:fluoride exporter
MKAPYFSPLDALYIALGGIFGSLLRTWIGAGFTGGFPVPTLLVNILGTAALAVLHATQHRIHARGRYLYMVGFCGSFTTVSLFSWETMELLRAGHLLAGMLNLGLPVIVAILLVNAVITLADRPRGGHPQ